MDKRVCLAVTGTDALAPLPPRTFREPVAFCPEGFCGGADCAGYSRPLWRSGAEEN